MATRIIGELSLGYADQLSGFAFTDFCDGSLTLDMAVAGEHLSSPSVLFHLSYPGYEIECRVGNGMVFIRRNGVYQHSTQVTGPGECQVAVQWDPTSIGCGIVEGPKATLDAMNAQMRSASTPFTLPPPGLLKLLREQTPAQRGVYTSAEDLFTTVLDCVHLTEFDIRRHGNERFVWGKDGELNRPRDEPDITRFVAGYLSTHAASRNFDVTCEPIAGGGNIDFYVVGATQGGLVRIAIEAKKADSSMYEHGFITQLPAYMSRIGTQYGIYLTYWLKSSDYPYPARHSKHQDLEVEVLHPIQRAPSIRTVGLDLSMGRTPGVR